MTDLEQPALFYDQTGQLVDIQYNAESIHVVNHLREGSNGKRCPVCHASPMRRTQLVWEENSRRHGAGTILLSNVAIRVAPPSRPRKPEPYLPPSGSDIFVLVILALVLAVPLFFFCAAVLSFDSLLIPGFAIVATGLMAWLIWRSYTKEKRKQANGRRRSKAEFHRQMQHYEARLKTDSVEFAKWKRSWFCPSCSAIVIEEE